jgi:hypothetical protein
MLTLNDLDRLLAIHDLRSDCNVREIRSNAMLRATKSATVMYDGEPHEIIAGRTGCVADHEIVRQHPELFGLSTPAKRAPARAISSPAKPKPAKPKPKTQAPAPAPITLPDPSRPAWLLDETTGPPPAVTPVRLRTDAPHRTRIRFLRSARADLREHSELSRDGRETGGGLLAARCDGGLEIVAVSGPVGNTARHVGWIRLDHDALDAWASRIRRDWGHKLLVAGAWHTHPNARSFLNPDAATPSPADLTCWGHRHADSQSIAMIVTPHAERGFSRPEPHAWTIRERLASLVAEPAEVTL